MLGRTNGHLARKPLDISYSSTMASLTATLVSRQSAAKNAPPRWSLTISNPRSCFTSSDNPPLLIIQSLSLTSEPLFNCPSIFLFNERKEKRRRRRKREREIKGILPPFSLSSSYPCRSETKTGFTENHPAGFPLHSPHSSERRMFPPSSCNRSHSRNRRRTLATFKNKTIPNIRAFAPDKWPPEMSLNIPRFPGILLQQYIYIYISIVWVPSLMYF